MLQASFSATCVRVTASTVLPGVQHVWAQVLREIQQHIFMLCNWSSAKLAAANREGAFVASEQ